MLYILTLLAILYRKCKSFRIATLSTATRHSKKDALYSKIRQLNVLIVMSDKKGTKVCWWCSRTKIRRKIIQSSYHCAYIYIYRHCRSKASVHSNKMTFSGNNLTRRKKKMLIKMLMFKKQSYFVTKVHFYTMNWKTFGQQCMAYRKNARWYYMDKIYLTAVCMCCSLSNEKS